MWCNVFVCLHAWHYAIHVAQYVQCMYALRKESSPKPSPAKPGTAYVLNFMGKNLFYMKKIADICYTLFMAIMHASWNSTFLLKNY